MARLPSYGEAVTGGHWLDSAAPYFNIRDVARLCRVSRRFYDQFAPRLWTDPLAAARQLGLHPDDELDWFVHLVAVHAKAVRPSTRQLVTALDLHGGGAAAGRNDGGGRGSAVAVTVADGCTVSDALRLACLRFPALRCIRLGRHGTHCDPGDLGRLARPDDHPEDGAAPAPLLLDVAGAGLPLPGSFFGPAYWRQLVYLDMSDLPESLRGLVRLGTFGRPPSTPGTPGAGAGSLLPSLRILKLRGRALDEAALAPVAAWAVARLWSLDLRRNRLSDASVPALFAPCFAAAADLLQTDGGRFGVEGRLAMWPAAAAAAAAPGHWCAYIVESAASATFAHPDRYLADAPVYSYDDDDRHRRQDRRPSRLTGTEPLRSDRAEDVQAALAGGCGTPAPDWHAVREEAAGGGICRPPAALTHLHLSDNAGFSIEGVEALFRCARGHLEHVDLAAPAMLLPRGGGDDGDVPYGLAGFVGRAHLVRPVFAANLRSLRVHHSLVTHVPTLTPRAGGGPVSARARLAYAETVLRARAELAFPQAFVPDLNPRLQSLTLAGLPRVSAGPLIDRLLRFLAQAHEQEAAIRAAAAAATAVAWTPASPPRFVARRHGPAMLRGLRRIRLEFAPWPATEDDAAALDRLDAEALLRGSAGPDGGFSFFGGDAAWVSAGGGSSTSSARAEASGDRLARDSDRTRVATAAGNQRFAHYPLPGTRGDGPVAADESEHVWATVDDDNGGGDRRSNSSSSVGSVPVWVGTGRPGPHAAVNAYMANLARAWLRARVRAATPDQVRAGVPAGTLVFNAAWDAILWADDDRSGAPGGTAAGSPRPMHDVVAAIRQFRAETKAAHRHWTGTLEVLLA